MGSAYDKSLEMSVGIARDELAARYRVAKRREYIAFALALIPGVGYLVLLELHGVKGLFPELNKQSQGWFALGFMVWMFVVMLIGTSRWTWRRAGLTCPHCGHQFRGTSFEVVMASGNCGGCGRRILSD